MRTHGMFASLLLVVSCAPAPVRQPGPPQFTNFGFVSGRVTMRPGDRASNAVNIGTQPQLTLADLDVTIDGPGLLSGVEDLGGILRLAVCSSLRVGQGKVRVALKAFPDYFVTADYSIGRPEVDPLAVLEPTQVLGRMGAVPTGVQWSQDATRVYVSWDTGVFTELSVATLRPLRSWIGLGTRTRLVSPGRVVSDGHAGYLFDLDARRALTWMPGPVLGWETSTLDTVSNGQTRGVTGAGDLLVVSDRSSGGGWAGDGAWVSGLLRGRNGGAGKRGTGRGERQDSSRRVGASQGERELALGGRRARRLRKSVGEMTRTEAPERLGRFMRYSTRPSSSRRRRSAARGPRAP